MSKDRGFTLIFGKLSMRVLGIETSCDDTGVAIFDATRGLLANCVRSQARTHAPYGGIVPELASRDHIQYLLPLIKQVMQQADSDPSEITAIAYTAGPGLVGSLMVGATFAKTLAWAWQIPAIPIHHMEAHLLTPFLDLKTQINFPFLALLVSGGHTMLVHAKSFGSYEVIGESVDDAVGEAFDKVAKLLGLPYPGGPPLERLAEQGNPNAFQLPRPMYHHTTLNFSFSGLKTSVMQLYKKQDQPVSDAVKADIASSFQCAAIDSLLRKCEVAIKKTAVKRLVIAGGVSANKYLRTRLEQLAKAYSSTLHLTDLAFCTDNGAMIAYTAYLQLTRSYYKKRSRDLTIKVRTNWIISDSHDF